MRSPGGPPAGAEWLIGRAIPTRVPRLSVLGDFHEEYEPLRRAGGVRAAVWYWRQAILVWMRYAPERRAARRARRRDSRRRQRTDRGPGSMSNLWYDFRHGLRSWARSPLLALTAVVTFTLGIGVPTTMFSIVHGVMRDLPFDRGEDIMYLGRTNVERGEIGLWVSQHDFADWREQQTSFEDLATYRRDNWNLSDDAHRPARVLGAAITPNAFSILGVPPERGRLLNDEDAAATAPPVALLSHRLWQNRYGGDSTVVGRSIRLNGSPHTVVGIMPERFAFPGRARVWTALALNLSRPRVADGEVQVFGRLVDGVSPIAAQTEFDGLAARQAAAYPETHQSLGAWVVPFTEERVGRELGPILYTMLAIVSTVLLIACANVANLLTAQAVRRSKEIAIRTALGATRARVLSEFLAQVIAVALIGAAGGILAAHLGIRLFILGMGDFVTRIFWIDIRIDGTVLGFVAAATVAASLLSSLLPALQASRTNVNALLKDETRGGSGFRLTRATSALVVAEVTFSCLLLVISSLMIKGLIRYTNADLAYPTDRILVGSIELHRDAYPGRAAEQRFFATLDERLGAAPGVAAAAFTSSPPGMNENGWPVAISGERPQNDGDLRQTRRVVVSPGYFDVLNAKILEGRGFGPEDHDGGLPVAVVNERFGRRFFPRESPVGHRIRFGPERWGLAWRTIVGVVPDLHMGALWSADPNVDGVYVPVSQARARELWVMVRTAGDPLSAVPAVRNAIEAIDPDLPLDRIDRLDLALIDATRQFRVFGTLFMVFGAGALFMASVGLYGVMAFSIGQRTREMGVRIALGATRPAIVSLVLKKVFAQLGVGLGLGLGLASVVAPVLREGFLGVSPWDASIFGAIVGVFVFTALTAAVAPTRRATRVDPMEALRAE